ncbi:PREDICTED: uncharacterized protein LOC104598108 isoform X1 [Nelumbo nucifera]|uniref:Uncharacterized protein LOC104598108 isoform X1 n=1 Tax=Nelumbo nucifera TaxID=4432 RepID=A0A1U7ZX35_NELNU|nr:PREDICTED: uncharacterized protein LOC104598108 isoform X1 [Nelumbo nucifera]
MKPRKEGRRTTSSATRSRTVDSVGLEPRSSGSRSPRVSRTASLVDRELIIEEDIVGFEGLHISPDDANPRSFPYSVKQQCWEKAEKIKGRDPDRWRRDALGNIVFRKLVGCPGCLCHDYDHIMPYSKGGKSTLENCQVLQAVTWIFWNYRPMVMFIVSKIRGVVASNNQGQTASWFPNEVRLKWTRVEMDNPYEVLRMNNTLVVLSVSNHKNLCSEFRCQMRIIDRAG